MIDRQALLRSEIERMALVLGDCPFEQFERAAEAVEQAVMTMDSEPVYQPVLYRITNTDAARASNPNAGNPDLLPLSATHRERQGTA